MYPQDKNFPIRDFMLWWNNKFPIDYWYRKKYNIAFNSKQHRQISLFDILCEWEEQNIAVILQNDRVLQEKRKLYNQTGVWIDDNEEEMSEQELDQFFESTSFEQLDDQDD